MTIEEFCIEQAERAATRPEPEDLADGNTYLWEFRCPWCERRFVRPVTHDARRTFTRRNDRLILAPVEPCPEPRCGARVPAEHKTDWNPKLAPQRAAVLAGLARKDAERRQADGA